MTDRKIPPEGARWERDDWTPDHADDEGRLTTYVERLERSEKLNAEQSAEIERLNAKLTQWEERRAEYDTVRAGRDANVMSLTRERDELSKRSHDAEQAHSNSKQINVEWDKAYKKLEGEQKSTEATLERERGAKKREIRSHRYLIVGIAVIAALLAWGWISALGSSSTLEDRKQELAGQLAAANNRVTSLESELRPTEELRAEITELTSQRDQANQTIASLRANLGRANQATVEANARRDRAERRGEMPGGANAYRQVRSAFLSYINALPSRFAVDAEYVGCVRGRVIDTLDDAYSSTYQRWDSFRDKTKRDFVQCKRHAGSYRERNAIHDSILNDYMYRDGNFLDRIAAQYGS